MSWVSENLWIFSFYLDCFGNLIQILMSPVTCLTFPVLGVQERLSFFQVEPKRCRTPLIIFPGDVYFAINFVPYATGLHAFLLAEELPGNKINQ